MRARLLAAFLAIAFTILVIQDLPLTSYLNSIERDRVLLSLERDAWTVADSAEPLLALRALPQLAALTSTYQSRSDARIDIVDSTSTMIASSTTTELGYDYSNRAEMEAALAGDAVTGQRVSKSLGGRIMFVAVPIRAGTEVIGALRLVYPTEIVDAIVGARVRSIYLTGVVTLLVAGTAAFLLAGAYTRRLRRIHAATERLATGDLAARVETVDRGAPELQGLEQAFNAMAARLQSLVESQRAFASDASHQLRTPLTALRLRLETAAAQAQDPDATEQALEQSLIEVQRLQVLIDGLLALARLEGREAHIAPQDVDALLEGRRDLWEPLAEERGITLTIDAPAGLRVAAAAGAADQVLDAYLDNALEFAPAGSALQLRVCAHDHGVDFHVIDAGPGMSADERERAFNRFWRGREDGAGSGLGLAIAARLAQVSGGSVRLDAAEPHGIDAVLSLKRA